MFVQHAAKDRPPADCPANLPPEVKSLPWIPTDQSDDAPNDAHVLGRQSSRVVKSQRPHEAS